MLAAITALYTHATDCTPCATAADRYAMCEQGQRLSDGLARHMAPQPLDGSPVTCPWCWAVQENCSSCRCGMY